MQIQTMSGQDPATVADLFDSSSRIRNLVQIDPVDFSDFDQLSRGERRRRARTTLHLRACSGEHNAPVWIHIPVRLHRPIPPTAAVKLVRLSRKRVARQMRYTVSITVDEPLTELTPARYAVAVDLGWRKIGDELRVGVWTGEDDPTRSRDDIRLPAVLIGGFEQADRIKSHRDEQFNVAVAALRQWLMAQETLPEWLSEATLHIEKWRGHHRLLRVVSLWRDRRIEGDTEIFDTLDAWRKREWHLEDFEANLRDRLVRYRREIFRTTAARLATSYQTLILEDMDLRDLVKKPKVEEGDTWREQRARANRQIAAPGMLRAALIQAFLSRGREVLKVDAKNSTRVHAACGRRLDADFFADIWVHCPHCDVLFDQDFNACLNLLGAVREPELAAT